MASAKSLVQKNIDDWRTSWVIWMYVRRSATHTRVSQFDKVYSTHMPGGIFNSREDALAPAAIDSIKRIIWQGFTRGRGGSASSPQPTFAAVASTPQRASSRSRTPTPPPSSLAPTPTHPQPFSPITPPTQICEPALAAASSGSTAGQRLLEAMAGDDDEEAELEELLRRPLDGVQLSGDGVERAASAGSRRIPWVAVRLGTDLTDLCSRRCSTVIRAQLCVGWSEPQLLGLERRIADHVRQQLNWAWGQRRRAPLKPDGMRTRRAMQQEGSAGASVPGVPASTHKPVHQHADSETASHSS